MFKKFIVSGLLTVLVNIMTTPLLMAKEIEPETIINLKSLQYISSETSYEGQKVNFELAEDVLDNDGSVILNSGATISGVISSLEPASNCGTSGKIEIRLCSIKQNGKTYPLYGVFKKSGKDKFDTDDCGRFVCNVFIGVLIWPYGLYEVCSKGKKTIIPQDAVFIYKVDRPITIQ